MTDKAFDAGDTILIICGDPGGASAVGPVINALDTEKVITSRNYAYNEAGAIWDTFGIKYENIPNDFSYIETLALLALPEIKLLFTGTSVNSIDLEKQFIMASKQTGLPSLALLDFWTNYTWRFSSDGEHLTHLPDKIAVMDEYALDEMVREGFESSKLVVTGQPAFDDLAAWRSSFTPERCIEVRNNLGLRRDELFVLFASQPLTSLYGTDVIQEKYLGFDEWVVLELLIQTLEDIKKETGAPIHLVIRPHPRETIELFYGLKSDILPVSVVESGTARSQVMAADLVVGMNTELLVEACYLGCITLSLQPGLRHPDRLPTNRLGFSQAVYSQEEIKPAVLNLLLDQKARKEMLENVNNFKLQDKAAANVLKLIFKMIDSHSENQEKS